MDGGTLGFPVGGDGTPTGDGGTTSAGDIFAALGAIDPAGDSGGSGSGGSNSGGLRDSRGDAFDPEQHIDPAKLNGDGSFRRKRRGRGGSTTGTRREGSKGNASVKTIENALVGIHAILAISTGFDDLRLSEPDESVPLALAVAEISKHYNIPMLDAKAMAWVGLVVVAGRVYGPKAALVKMEMDARKEKAREAEGTGTVLHFPHGPQVAG